jgi:UDP-3-O-[3-hydroxymyristoyl] glucosamine N-acyltransferase
MKSGRAARFNGSCLLIPAGAQFDCVESREATVVRCRSPKLALCLVAKSLFPESLVTGWPRYGEASIARDAEIDPTAVLAAGVVIASGVRIGPDVVIGPNTCIAHADVEAGVQIGANCSIGLPGFGYERDIGGGWQLFPHIGRVRIETGVRIGSNTSIDRGALGDTVIRRGARVDNLVHVAHNCDIGEDALIIAHAMLGGSVSVGAAAWVAPSAAIKNQISIGANAVIGLGAVVLRDVPPETTVVGNPAKPLQAKE